MLKVLRSGETDIIKKRLLDRAGSDYTEQQKTVDGILQDIKENQDEALFKYIRTFDKFEVDENNILVSEKEIEDAYKEVSDELIEIMKEAAENIREFHMCQLRENWWVNRPDGSKIGQMYIPVNSAGVYVPGGKAAYPSSVLMNIIPAKCAGVENIYVATPAVGGEVAPVTIVAAKIAGADKIYKMGGAQAVGAFAYGTQTIPMADKITGPGNIYVALAKKSVYGQTGIDMIAGPSEVLVIADKHANPKYVAADFLSQAEHDELAACILVTDNEEFALEVKEEITAQTSVLPKKDIVEQSLNNYGTIILCENMEECVMVSNKIAPEHLEILTKNPEELLLKIKNAGSIFLGEYSPEPLGDYFAGTNHVLPTGGTARFSSPLNVDDFQKKSGVIYYNKEGFEKVADKVAAFARSEGLEAHARSMTIRMEEEK